MPIFRFSPELLRQARLDSDRKQLEAALHVGVDVRTLRYWERGTYPPDAETLARLAAFYGVSPASLYVVHDGSDDGTAGADSSPPPVEAAAR